MGGAGISNAASPQQNLFPLKGKTMIFERGGVSAGTSILHTVTAGKTFYLVSGGLGYVATIDNRDVMLHAGSVSKTLLFMTSQFTATYQTSNTRSEVVNYPQPIPIAAGSEISVWSSDAAINADGWIIGWEE